MSTTAEKRTPDMAACKKDGRLDLVGLSRDEMGTALAEMGLPRFRLKQLWHWIYNRGVTDFTKMTDIAKARLSTTDPLASGYFSDAEAAAFARAKDVTPSSERRAGSSAEDAARGEQLQLAHRHVPRLDRHQRRCDCGLCPARCGAATPRWPLNPCVQHARVYR